MHLPIGLLLFLSVRNDVWLLRHGRSQANEQGLIVSQAENAVDGYGLAPEGRAQAQRVQLPLQSVALLSVETAKIVELTLAATTTVSLHIDAKLRERDFGDYRELSSDRNYQRVWEDDVVGVTQHGVELVGRRIRLGAEFGLSPGVGW